MTRTHSPAAHAASARSRLSASAKRFAGFFARQRRTTASRFAHPAGSFRARTVGPPGRRSTRGRASSSRAASRPTSTRAPTRRRTGATASSSPRTTAAPTSRSPRSSCSATKSSARRRRAPAWLSRVSMFQIIGMILKDIRRHRGAGRSAAGDAFGGTRRVAFARPEMGSVRHRSPDAESGGPLFCRGGEPGRHGARRLRATRARSYSSRAAEGTARSLHEL